LTAAVIGGIIGIGGSVFSFFLTERSRRNELKDRSRKDLIAELEQNKQYQSVSHYIDLEDAAYKRFTERGFFHQLSLDLQRKLQELYALIHEKNGLISYYNSTGLAVLSARQRTVMEASFFLSPERAEAKALQEILAIIRTREERISGLIDEILPKLKSST
jgi:hypothetical protein